MAHRDPLSEAELGQALDYAEEKLAGTTEGRMIRELVREVRRLNQGGSDGLLVLVAREVAMLRGIHRFEVRPAARPPAAEFILGRDAPDGRHVRASFILDEADAAGRRGDLAGLVAHHVARAVAVLDRLAGVEPLPGPGAAWATRGR